MSIIEVKNVKKHFGSNEVLNDISFNVEKGEVVCLIGSSGSGKSTLLRCINLLETIDEGDIVVLGNSIKSINNINEFRQKVGMVFQQFNLFNNMNVLDNCIIAQVKVLKRNKQEAKEIAIKNLQKVGMYDFINAYPSTLSGGQKQRVAIARALCVNPEILLFDEPTSALDPKLVKQVFKIIKELANKGKAILIVTHDIKFANDISNRVMEIKKEKFK